METVDENLVEVGLRDVRRVKVDVEEFVDALKASEYGVHALLFAICEVRNLGVNEIGEAGRVWAWRCIRLFLGFGKRREGFRG